MKKGARRQTDWRQRVSVVPAAECDYVDSIWCRGDGEKSAPPFSYLSAPNLCSHLATILRDTFQQTSWSNAGAEQSLVNAGPDSWRRRLEIASQQQTGELTSLASLVGNVTQIQARHPLSLTWPCAIRKVASGSRVGTRPRRRAESRAPTTQSFVKRPIGDRAESAYPLTSYFATRLRRTKSQLTAPFPAL